MTAYYNELDPAAAAWLRELIAAGLIAPGEVDERSIEDVRPDDLRGFTQCHFFAGIGVWSYALRNAGWPDDRHVWTGSCPCFVAGTLVLTKRGHIPVEGVVVGDEVWTHRQRWRRVLRTGQDVKPVGTLVGQGHFGLVGTADHPFWSRDRLIRNTRINGRHARIHEVEPPRWRRAEDMPGAWWAMPARYDGDIPMPIVGGIAAETLGFLCGLYVGDGWVGNGTRAGRLILGLNEEKRTAVRAALPDLEWHESKHRTGVRLEIRNPDLVAALRQGFGEKALCKILPPWLLAAPMPVREGFLRGWDLTDGTRRENSGVRQVTTASRDLAVTGRMLLVSMGYSVSMRKVETAPTTLIEGRTVNQADYYVLGRSRCGRYVIRDDDHSWFKAKDFVRGAIHQTVYNIEVADDHSYLADGIVVHNCQPFSAAGKGAGFADERHLWPAFHHLIRECRPDVVLGEQVASKDGLGWWDVVQTDLEGAGYASGAVDTCAAGFGAPHIRQRLYWMAHAAVVGRIGRRAGETRSEPGAVERPDGLRDACRLADAARSGRGEERPHARGELVGDRPEGLAAGLVDGCGDLRPGNLRGLADADADDAGLEGRRQPGRERADQRAVGPHGMAGGLADAAGTGRPGPTNGLWRDADWLLCRDGKWRPVEPGTFPLAHGAPARVGRLRGYGNAINAAQATAFVEAAIDTIEEQGRGHRALRLEAAFG